MTLFLTNPICTEHMYKQSHKFPFVGSSLTLCSLQLDVFKDFLVLHERFGGSARIRICKILSSSSASFAVESLHIVSGRESTFDLSNGSNWEFDTKFYRYRFETFNTPPVRRRERRDGRDISYVLY